MVKYGLYFGCVEGDYVGVIWKRRVAGVFYGILLGRVNGFELRSSNEVYLVNFNVFWLGDLEGFYVRNCYSEALQ